MEKSLTEDLSAVPDEEEKQFKTDDLAIWIDPIGKCYIWIINH